MSTTEANRTVGERTMGYGLRAIALLAASSTLDRVGMRTPMRRAIHRGSRGGFRSAALAGTRVNPYRTATGRGRSFSRTSPRGTDVYRLARSPIQVSDGMEFFERKLAGGMAL